MARASWRRLYGTKEWFRLRAAQLQAEPACALCLAIGKVVEATVCDHRRPHRGDPVLFYDPQNLQSLCKTCHDSTKQRLEKSGVLQGCDASGVPLDPNHHWNS